MASNRAVDTVRDAFHWALLASTITPATQGGLMLAAVTMPVAYMRTGMYGVYLSAVLSVMASWAVGCFLVTRCLCVTKRSYVYAFPWMVTQLRRRFFVPLAVAGSSLLAASSAMCALKGRELDAFDALFATCITLCCCCRFVCRRQYCIVWPPNVAPLPPPHDLIRRANWRTAKNTQPAIAVTLVALGICVLVALLLAIFSRRSLSGLFETLAMHTVVNSCLRGVRLALTVGFHGHSPPILQPPTPQPEAFSLLAAAINFLARLVCCVLCGSVLCLTCELHTDALQDAIGTTLGMTPSILASYLALPPDDVGRYLAANLMVRLVMGGPPSLPKNTPVLHHTSRPTLLTMTNTHPMAAQYVTFSPPLRPRPSSLTSAVIDSQWCPAAIRSLLLGWGGGGGAVTCYAANAGLEGGFVLNTWVYDVFHRESNMVWRTYSEGSVSLLRSLYLSLAHLHIHLTSKPKPLPPPAPYTPSRPATPTATPLLWGIGLADVIDMIQALIVITRDGLLDLWRAVYMPPTPPSAVVGMALMAEGERDGRQGQQEQQPRPAAGGGGVDLDPFFKCIALSAAPVSGKEGPVPLPYPHAATHMTDTHPPMHLHPTSLSAPYKRPTQSSDDRQKHRVTLTASRTTTSASSSYLKDVGASDDGCSAGEGMGWLRWARRRGRQGEWRRETMHMQESIVGTIPLALMHLRGMTEWVCLSYDIDTCGMAQQHSSLQQLVVENLRLLRACHSLLAPSRLEHLDRTTTAHCRTLHTELELCLGRLLATFAPCGSARGDSECFSSIPWYLMDDFEEARANLQACRRQ